MLNFPDKNLTMDIHCARVAKHVHVHVRTCTHKHTGTRTHDAHAHAHVHVRTRTHRPLRMVLRWGQKSGRINYIRAGANHVGQ